MGLTGSRSNTGQVLELRALATEATHFQQARPQQRCTSTMPRRPLCLYDDTSRWPLDHPVLKNGKHNRLLGFRPQPPSNHDETRRRLLAMSSGMGPAPAPPLGQTPTCFWSADESDLQCFPVFEPQQKFGDGPLLSGPCIIIMTLPTTDDIWITAPLFQYPPLPVDHSTINQNLLFGLRPL